MSLPRSVSDWRSVLGPVQLPGSEYAELAAALAQPPSPCIRLRPEVPVEILPWRLDPVPWHDRGFFVRGDGNTPVRASEHVAYYAGCYYIQDAASLLPVRLAEVQPDMLVCDLCAAPGGKATAILEELHQGWLLANETIRSRLAPLLFNLARHGMARYLVSSCDPADLSHLLEGQFDLVLVDAPCSGQSLVSRGKQAHTAFSDATIRFCAAREARILNRASRLVRTGGCLVYATCTLSYAENEALIEAFVKENPEWRLEPCVALEAWRSPVLEGAYRIWPHREGCGSAFAARLRLVGNRRAAPTPAARNIAPRPTQLTALPCDWREWGSPRFSNFIWEKDWQLFALPEEPPAWWGIVRCGPEFAFRKGETWFPAYGLAMRRDGWWRPIRFLVCEEEQARRFLAGQPVACAERGWTLAVWNGQPLGWAKSDGRLAKSHVPKAGRWPRSG